MLLDKRFPNTTSTYPHPYIALLAKRVMACFACEKGDWDNAESLLEPSIKGPMKGLWIGPGNPHIDTNLSYVVYSTLSLYLCISFVHLK